MENKAFNVKLQKNPLISIRVIPGHFTASSTHTSHYLDLSVMKSNATIARDVAKELARPYLTSTPVETIVCMGRTEVIGAFLAQELMQSGLNVVNQNTDVYVMTPLVNDVGTLSFTSSMLQHIVNRQVLLLTTWALSGSTLDRVFNTMSFYGAKIAGISSLFVVNPESMEQNINTLFTSNDIEGFKLYSPRNCELCKAGIRLDALISSEGYTRV